MATPGPSTGASFPAMLPPGMLGNACAFKKPFCRSPANIGSAKSDDICPCCLFYPSDFLREEARQSQALLKQIDDFEKKKDDEVKKARNNRKTPCSFMIRNYYSQPWRQACLPTHPLRRSFCTPIEKDIPRVGDAACLDCAKDLQGDVTFQTNFKYLADVAVWIPSHTCVFIDPLYKDHESRSMWKPSPQATHTPVAVQGYMCGSCWDYIYPRDGSMRVPNLLAFFPWNGKGEPTAEVTPQWCILGRLIRSCGKMEGPVLCRDCRYLFPGQLIERYTLGQDRHARQEPLILHAMRRFAQKYGHNLCPLINDQFKTEPWWERPGPSDGCDGVSVHVRRPCDKCIIRFDVNVFRNGVLPTSAS